MDVELAKTFLIIAEEGSFRKAAERLNVTQSTISARIQTLESFLGRQIFLRGKNGVFFTAAGTQFKKYAENMVSSWQQVRQKLAMSSDNQTVINVGYESSISDDFVLKWLLDFYGKLPNVAIRIDSGLTDVLIKKIFEARLDFAIVHSPQSHAGLVFEEIIKEKIVLVSSDATNQISLENNYIHIDWGRDFRLSHSLSFPELELPHIFIENGSLGLKYILANKSLGYFPENMVKKYVDEGQLNIIADAPVFSVPVYLVYSKDRKDESFKLALEDARGAIKSF